MVSVCIAVYNGARFVEKQLKTVLNQTRRADEVIICDDLSNDGTAQICRRFIIENDLENWTVYENEKNLGYCLNFYGAFEKAKGDIIFICDQDDEWYENKIEVMCKVLEQNENIKVLSCRYDIINSESEIIQNKKIPYLGNVFDGSLTEVTINSLIGCSWVRGFSMCFKSELKQYIKPIDVKSLLAHDWFINCIGSLMGSSMILNTKLCAYRYHGGNLSLSDMTRKTFLGSRQKRIDGLKESVEAHMYLSELAENFNLNAKADIIEMISFEKNRLEFLNNKNIGLWLKLLCKIKCYKRYYKSFKGALRVWIGDFCYAYNINFKK